MSATLIEPAGSLAEKTARGVFWMFALRIADRGVSLVRTIVLARLLAPDDFGVMGVALLMLSGLEVVTMTGFDAALIQKKGRIESYLDAAWAAQFIRGLLLAIVLFLAAPLVAIFFEEPRVTLVLQVLALSELIKGCQSIGIVYFHKDLEFHKEFAYRFTNTIVKLAVSIPAALILRDALALVIGVVIGDVVSCLMSYALHPYRPRLRFEWDKMKELFGFGKWILGSSLLTFLCNQGDDVFLGKMLGPATLGLYQMAYLISNLPATEITHVAARVSFPAYAKLQDSLDKLREMHLAVLRLVALVSVPLATGILLFARDVTALLLGPKWEPMVPAMQLLVFWGLMRSVGAPIGSLLQASGRLRVHTRLQLTKFLLLAICIYPMTKAWGMTGTALAVVVHTLPIEVYVHYLAVRLLRSPVVPYLQSLLFPLLASSIMFLAVWTLKMLIFQSVSVIGLVVLVVIGWLTYAAVIGLLEFCFQYGLRDIVSRVLAKPFQQG